jgi:hypothetical protein
VKTLDSRFVLLLLILGGVAVAGWSYGLHWKRIALGGAFTPGERLIIQLQDQVKALNDENQSLRKQLHPTADNPAAAGEEAPPLP